MRPSGAKIVLINCNTTQLAECRYKHSGGPVDLTKPRSRFARSAYILRTAAVPRVQIGLCAPGRRGAFPALSGASPDHLPQAARHPLYARRGYLTTIPQGNF